LTGATAVAKCQTFTVGVEFELFFKTFRQPIRQIARASVRYGYIRGLRHRNRNRNRSRYRYKWRSGDTSSSTRGIDYLCDDGDGDAKQTGSASAQL